MNSPIDPPPSHLLTLLFGARNDTYMGDFKFRFSTCLNLLARNLEKIGRLADVEVLVVDWNSDVPLHTVLPLSREARQLVHFIVVPPEVARPAQKDSPFPIPIVQNVAIRRARGQFIAQTDSDILFTGSSLRTLFDVIDGRVAEVPIHASLMVASRRHMPFQQILRKPSLDEIDAYLARNASVFPKEEFFPGFATPSALAMVHRDHWRNCRGYDEQLIYWGWMEIDLYLRLTQRMPWYDLAGFGVNLIHIEHYTAPRSAAANPRKMNPTAVSKTFEVNDEEWGLADMALEITRGIVNAESEPNSPDEDTETVRKSMTDPSLQRFLNEFAQAAKLPGDQFHMFIPVAWYARSRFPRTYVEIGVRYSAAAAVVAHGCPGVEIYGVDSWMEEGGASNLQSWASSNAIAYAGRHQNYTRFVTGDPSTALTRLFDAAGAPTSVDLALVRTDPVFGDAIQNAMMLARKLGVGGAVVITGRTLQEFGPAWSVLRREFPNWVGIIVKSNSGEAQTGIAIKPR